MRLSIRAKLVVTALAAMLIGVALIEGAITAITLPPHSHMDPDSISITQAGNIASQQAAAVSEAVTQGAHQAQVAQAAIPPNLPRRVSVEVIDKDGRVWVDTHGEVGRTVTAPEAAAWLKGMLYPHDGLVTMRQPILSDGELWGFYAITFFSSTAPQMNMMSDGLDHLRGLRPIVLGSIALALLMNFALLWAFGWHLVKPIHRLSAVVSRIASGDLSVRTELGMRRDELGQFAGDLDVMASRLEEARDQVEVAEKARRYMVAAASHDLRTPLTALLAHAEAVRTGVSEDPGQSLIVIEEKGLLLKQLINDLFELAALDANDQSSQTLRLNVSELVRQAVVGALPELEAAGIAVDADIPEEPLWANLAPGKLERVMDNLLANARKYGAGGHWIGVRVLAVGPRIRVEVANRGPAIPEAQARQIFERFYRSDSARTGNVGGSGLGLAIASEIVARHGGAIGMESPTGGGVTFWFDIPAV